ncbi:MAG: glycoside-pentoside-hexuronide (GPH):cation symporter [Firmicutes bacterium]|nr:glycoside-pentoside-hexuronide (GPH):cation symporter [Bacillota bacterium]
MSKHERNWLLRFLTGSETHTAQGDKKLNLKQIFGFGAGDFGLRFIWDGMAQFFMLYITNSVFSSYDDNTRKMALAVVGTIILLTRILDGVADIATGFLIERGRFKGGKARPWIIIFIWPLALCFAMLFNVPLSMSVTGKIIYVAVFYNLVMAIFYSGVALPYNTLLSMITRDQHERGVVTIIRMALGALSMAATTFMVLIFNAYEGGEENQSAWTLFNLICTAFLIGAVLVTYFSQKEVHYNEKAVKVGFGEGMRALGKNKYFIIITIFTLLFYTSGALTQSVNVYYSKYILGSLDNVIVLMLASFAPMLIAYPFLPKLMQKFGKRKICLFGLVLSTATCFIYFIDVNSIWFASLGLLFRNLGLMPTNVMFMASITDTIEYGEWKTGVRTEGLINSAASFGMKIGTGIGGAIVLWTLAIVGFDSELSTQTTKANNGILLLMIALPAIMYLIMAFLMYLFKLDKNYNQIIKELEERKLKASEIKEEETAQEEPQSETLI